MHQEVQDLYRNLDPLQVAAGSDFGRESEPSTSAALPETAVPAAQQSEQQPSTAGDALLAAQLQEEDQVAIACKFGLKLCSMGCALPHIHSAASFIGIQFEKACRRHRGQFQSLDQVALQGRDSCADRLQGMVPVQLTKPEQASPQVLW